MHRPRFVPTLTAVRRAAAAIAAAGAAGRRRRQRRRESQARVRGSRQRASAPQRVPTSCGRWTDAFRLEEQLLHRVLQRVDLSLEERLSDAVSAAVQQQLDAMMPRLRAEIETVLRALVRRSAGQELSESTRVCASAAPDAWAKLRAGSTGARALRSPRRGTCSCCRARIERPVFITLIHSMFWRFPMQLKWTAVALAALTLVACGKKEEAGRARRRARADRSGARACRTSGRRRWSSRSATSAPPAAPIAHLGKDNELGAKMAIEDLNAKGIKIGDKVAKFELLAEDDAGDPKQGTAVAQKLVDSKVNGVVGHLNSGTTIPASKLYSDAGIPQISPSATNPKYTRQGFKTTFRVVADDTQLGGTLGKYAVETLKGKNIAVIDDRTAYGQGVAEEFEKAVKAAGGTIVGHEFTTDKSTDFNAILTKLKGTKPDVLFFGGMDAVGGPMLKQVKQLGMNVKFMGGDGLCTGELAKLAGDAIGEDMVVCAEAGGVDGDFKAAAGRLQGQVQGQERRRRADLCTVRVRRGQRAGRRHGQGRFVRSGEVPAGTRQDRVQGRDRPDRLRRKGRHQERRADAVHLQGWQARADRRGALSCRTPLRQQKKGLRALFFGFDTGRVDVAPRYLRNKCGGFGAGFRRCRFLDDAAGRKDQRQQCQSKARNQRDKPEHGDQGGRQKRGKRKTNALGMCFELGCSCRRAYGKCLYRGNYPKAFICPSSRGFCNKKARASQETRATKTLPRIRPSGDSWADPWRSRRPPLVVLADPHRFQLLEHSQRGNTGSSLPEVLSHSHRI